MTPVEGISHLAVYRLPTIRTGEHNAFLRLDGAHGTAPGVCITYKGYFRPCNLIPEAIGPGLKSILSPHDCHVLAAEKFSRKNVAIAFKISYTVYALVSNPVLMEGQPF